MHSVVTLRMVAAVSTLPVQPIALHTYTGSLSDIIAMHNRIY